MGGPPAPSFRFTPESRPAFLPPATRHSGRGQSREGTEREHMGRGIRLGIGLVVLGLSLAVGEGGIQDKPYCQTVKRSRAAVRRFMRESGHPRGWKGHVVDHV